jgi:hypothetical protein
MPQQRNIPNRQTLARWYASLAKGMENHAEHIQGHKDQLEAHYRTLDALDRLMGRGFFGRLKWLVLGR